MIRSSTVIARADVRDVPAAEWDEALDAAVAAGALHPDEAALARMLPPARRATFVAGRTALRTALDRLPAARRPGRETPVLRTPRGAPALPAHLTGSVTHKRTLALAAVAPREASLQHLGVDLERRPTERDLAAVSVARKILTAREYDFVQQWGDHTLEGREQVLVHFALKEAVYKAIDPFVERYVRFTEVELDASRAHEVRVTLHLPEATVADVRVVAGWQFEDEWIVAWAESHR